MESQIVSFIFHDTIFFIPFKQERILLNSDEILTTLSHFVPFCPILIEARVRGSR